MSPTPEIGLTHVITSNASRRGVRLTRARTILVAAVTVGFLPLLWVGQPANAAQTELDPDSAFCSSVLALQFSGVIVNLDSPGVPFFNDGNADGIADALQVADQRNNLPQLASGIDALTADAPDDLKEPLSLLGSEIASVAGQPAPTSAAESQALAAPIESLAAQVQPTLASCHDDAPTSSEAYDPYAEAEAEAERRLAQQATTLLIGSIIGVALCALAILPLILATVRLARPIVVNEAGSHFEGSLRRWQVQTITGIVADTSQYTTTTQTSQAGPSGQFNVSSFTTVNERLRLVLADGSATDVSLTNFRAFPVVGDTVSVCIARKGSIARTFSLLNHTTAQSTTAPTEIFRLRAGGDASQTFWIFLAVGAVVFTGTVGVLLVGLFLNPLGLLFAVASVALLITLVVLARRGGDFDMGPLWRRGEVEARQLPAAQ